MALSPYISDQSSFSRLALSSLLSRKASSVPSVRSGSRSEVTLSRPTSFDSFQAPKSSSKVGNLGDQKSGKGGKSDPGGYGGYW